MIATAPILSRAASVHALSAPFRSGGDAAGLPQRVRILAWGANVARPKGAVILVDDSTVALAANQELVGIDRVPMDYEHQSFKGHANFLPDPRHSPGSGVIEVIPGDGVYLSALEYTPNGQAHAASYQDVSAVVHLDKQGRPLWISSVALTQRGAVAGMEFAQAVAALSALTENKPPIMQNTADFRSLLVTLLKLPADVTDEQISSAVEQHPSAQETDMKDTSTEALSAMESRLAALETSQVALSSAEADRERNALVARATQEGKVIPLSADLIKQTSVAVLSAMVEALPAGEVQLENAAKGEKPGERVEALSADEKSAAKALGLSEDEYRSGRA